MFSGTTHENDFRCDCGRDQLPGSVFCPECQAAIKEKNEKIRARQLIFGMKLAKVKAVP